MRAYRFSGPGEIGAVEVPDPKAGAGEILLKVRYVGLCGSDLSTYRGTSSMVRYPVIPGHEISAEVAELGPDVSLAVSVGQRVTVRPYFNCGTCPACRSDRPNACQFNQTLGVQRDGALCEWISVPQEHVFPLADGVSAVEAALIEPLSVGFHLTSRCGVGAGERVAVFGCGAVGLGAIAAASFRGAEVTAIDISPEKLALASRLGASSGIDSASTDPVQVLLGQTGGEGMDVTIECAGLPVTFIQALDAAKFTGRMGVVSYTTKEVSFNTKPIVSKELNLFGSRNALSEFEDVQDLILNSSLPVTEIVTEQVELDEVPRVLPRWATSPGSITKVLVRVS